MPNGNGNGGGSTSPTEGTPWYVAVVQFVANIYHALGFRGGTQHLTFQEAMGFANAWEGKLRAVWEPVLSGGELPILARHYGEKLRAVMLSGAYWGVENLWSNDAAFDLLGAPSEGWNARLSRLVWLHAGWIAIHVDRDNFAYQFNEFWWDSLRHISSAENPTPGTTRGLMEIVAPGLVPLGTTGVPGITPGTGGGSSGASMAGGGKVALVVGLGALAFWGIPKLLEGKE